MMIYLHDYESILCDSSLGRVLAVIFKNRLQSGSFPNNWKKVKLQNYRPVSLLSICKIFGNYFQTNL